MGNHMMVPRQICPYLTMDWEFGRSGVEGRLGIRCLRVVLGLFRDVRAAIQDMCREMFVHLNCVRQMQATYAALLTPGSRGLLPQSVRSDGEQAAWLGTLVVNTGTAHTKDAER